MLDYQIGSPAAPLGWKGRATQRLSGVQRSQQLVRQSGVRRLAFLGEEPFECEPSTLYKCRSRPRKISSSGFVHLLGRRIETTPLSISTTIGNGSDNTREDAHRNRTRTRTRQRVHVKKKPRLMTTLGSTATRMEGCQTTNVLRCHERGSIWPRQPNARQIISLYKKLMNKTMRTLCSWNSSSEDVPHDNVATSSHIESRVG